MTWDWDKLKQQQQRGDFGKHPPDDKPKRKKQLWELPTWVFNTGYFIIVIALAIGLFFPIRWLHYKFAYEGKVEQKIIEMVKPEALKEKI